MKPYESEAERLWRRAAMWSYISIGFAAFAVIAAVVSVVTR